MHTWHLRRYGQESRTLRAIHSVWTNPSRLWSLTIPIENSLAGHPSRTSVRMWNLVMPKTNLPSDTRITYIILLYRSDTGISPCLVLAKFYSVSCSKIIDWIKPALRNQLMDQLQINIIYIAGCGRVLSTPFLFNLPVCMLCCADSTSILSFQPLYLFFVVENLTKIYIKKC